MTRLRLAGLLVLAALLAASLWVTPRRTVELVDEAGALVDDGYVAYEYSGQRPNFVHPVTYRARPLALTRSDRAGHITIPTAVHLHTPFPIKTHPTLRIELVYVPRLHNAWGQLNDGSPSRAGIFTIEAPGRRAVVSDLADRPELWEGTLRNIASLLHRLVFRPAGEPQLADTDPVTAAHAHALIGHFHTEYDAFLARYRDVERPRPSMPDHVRWSAAEEQRRWTEMVEDDLRREPRWGPLITRLFEGERRAFDQMLVDLPAEHPDR